MSSSALLAAADMGDVARVKRLLSPISGVDVNIRGDDGITALLVAAANGETEVVEVLLMKGAELDMCDSAGNTALIMAAGEGHAEVVEVLLEAGAKASAANKTGGTALLSAASQGSEEMVRALVTHGAATEAKTHKGHTALSVAAYTGHVGVVGILLAAGANPQARDDDGNTSLIHAARSGSKDMAVALLQHGAELHVCNHFGDTALMSAARTDSVALVEYLLEKGADTNAQDKKSNTALIHAAVLGFVDVIQALLRYGADPQPANDDGETALLVASRRGHWKAVCVLVEAGAACEPRGKKGYTALTYAAEKGDADVVRVLLANGADPWVKDDDGRTPMFHAYGKLELHQMMEQAAVPPPCDDPPSDAPSFQHPQPFQPMGDGEVCVCFCLIAGNGPGAGQSVKGKSMSNKSPKGRGGVKPRESPRLTGSSLESPRTDTHTHTPPPLTRFAVRVRPGGRVYITRNSPYIISNLLPGEEYAVEIAAENAAGRGPYCDASVAVKAGGERKELPPTATPRLQGSVASPQLEQTDSESDEDEPTTLHQLILTPLVTKTPIEPLKTDADAQPYASQLRLSTPRGDDGPTGAGTGRRGSKGKVQPHSARRMSSPTLGFRSHEPFTKSTHTPAYAHGRSHLSLEEDEVFISGYKVLQEVRGDKFGRRFMVQAEADNCPYTLTMMVTSKKKVVHELLEEMVILKSLDHTNVLKYHRAFADSMGYFGTRICFVTEPAGRNLTSVIGLEPGLQESSKRQLARGIMEGIEYLHQARLITHGDLRPENIILTADGVPKIGNFPLNTTPDHVSLHPVAGTATTYLAPEMLFGDESSGSSFAADIWAYGLIVLEIILNSRVEEHVLQPAAPACREHLNVLIMRAAKYDKLVGPTCEACLETDPQARSTAASVIAYLRKHVTTMPSNRRASRTLQALFPPMISQAVGGGIPVDATLTKSGARETPRTPRKAGATPKHG